MNEEQLSADDALIGAAAVDAVPDPNGEGKAGSGIGVAMQCGFSSALITEASAIVGLDITCAVADLGVPTIRLFDALRDVPTDEDVLTFDLAVLDLDEDESGALERLLGALAASGAAVLLTTTRKEAPLPQDFAGSVLYKPFSMARLQDAIRALGPAMPPIVGRGYAASAASSDSGGE